MVGGHATHTVDVITYSSVFTQEIVCIALMMTVLQNLEVKAEDILNLYVMTPNREYGDYAGKSSIMVRA